MSYNSKVHHYWLSLAKITLPPHQHTPTPPTSITSSKKFYSTYFPVSRELDCRRHEANLECKEDLTPLSSWWGWWGWGWKWSSSPYYSLCPTKKGIFRRSDCPTKKGLILVLIPTVNHRQLKSPTFWIFRAKTNRAAQSFAPKQAEQPLSSYNSPRDRRSLVETL